MPPPPHSRPENQLKRAQELIGVGQSQAALSLLHDHVMSKRIRNNPIASLEPVMLLFVELCVDLRKGKLAKDGLYQYKNIAQNTNIGTIELVFKKFIELAENKVTEAQTKANDVQSSLDSAAPTANVEDLEATETPESILLSTVSGEQARDRTDRAIVTPWLKFLWETYRTVLDIFKNNARLEIMYQSTAHQAFQFCSKYARKTEFRRLCELLRNHLQNAAKFSSQMHAINLSEPDTLQRHLDTRFQQLNVAVDLELWQEAFRSVEDIHTLLNLSKRPAKNVMMANYFEKLTRIFLVSENYLFHAAAWSRYYNLLRQSAAALASGQSPKKDNPAITEADMTKAASYVLLSALSIPVISTSRSRGALVDVDEAKKNKNVRLTNVLGMSQAPTRAVLFKDALSKGLLKRVRPEIRQLYNILEVDFHPLSICKEISPILSQIGADEEMRKYVAPLQQVILTRLFQQLSQVYESVELKFVLNLAQFPDPFTVSSGTIEKFIMNGCKKGDLAIRINHAAGVLSFESDVFSSARALHPGAGAGSADNESSSVQQLQSTPAEIVRFQLTRLASSLYLCCQYVDPTANEERQKAKEAALERAKAGAGKEHQDTLARREVIERKKQAASSALAQREKEEATKKKIRAQQLQDAEIRRLEDEQRERELRRLKAEQARVQREEIEKQLSELKQGMKGMEIGDLDISELDSGRLRALKLAALEKEKTELGERLKVTGRRIDHLERAFRIEEAKHLPEDYAAQRQTDQQVYEKASSQTLTAAESKHKADVSLKHRLGRLVPIYENFRDTVREQRKVEFDKRKKAAERELKQKMDARRQELKDTKARERRELEEKEQMEREEEERLQREEEAKAAEEEEEKRKQAEWRAKKIEEKKQAGEQAQRQAQREAEAAERAKARKTNSTIAPRAPEKPAVSEPVTAPGGPPKLSVAGKQPTWREKEAAKKAAEAASGGPGGPGNTSEPSADGASAEADPSGRSGYVPPQRRDAGPPAPRWESSTRERGGRDESPASRPSEGRYQAPRSFSRDPERDSASPAPDATRALPSHLRNEIGDKNGEVPPSNADSAAPKYRPGAFRGRT